MRRPVKWCSALMAVLVGLTVTPVSPVFAIETAPLSAFNDAPDPFKVTGTTNSTISFRVNAAAVVTVGLYDSQNTLVRTLVKDASYASSLTPVTLAWDGKSDAGTLVEDGIYTYKLSGTDSTGASFGPVSGGTITTDKTAPVFSGVVATPNPFSPSATGTMSIHYSLNEDANVTIGIYNSANTLVKTIQSAAPNKAGANRVTWDGKDNAGAVLPDGAYSYRILASDKVGLSRSTTGVFKIDAQAPVISDVRDLNDPLKVTGTTAATIYYSLSEQANVTLKVYDSAGRAVRTLVNNISTASGARAVAWNGMNDAGTAVADGVYTYKINAVDTTGKVAPEATGTITTDQTAPTISNQSVTPNPFETVNGNTASIKYDLSEDAKVTVGVYNSANTLVRTLASALPNKAGANSVTWDGKNSEGIVVPNGPYSYRILATDIVGFSRSATGVFTVGGATPVISSVTDTVDPLKLTGTTKSSINYTLSQEATVSIKLYDKSNTLVRTLVDNVKLAAGLRTIAWDGKNSAGAVVESGTYTYKINAVNGLGRAATEVSGTITGDKDAPGVNVAVTPQPFDITKGGQLTFQYDLTKDAKVTLKILTTTDKLVRTITNGVSAKAGANSILWDGKDSLGKPMLVGTYKYEMTATDAVGFVTTKTGPITIDSPGPVISLVSARPETLKVTGTNAATLYFTLSEPAYVTLIVYDSNGRQVRSVLNKILYWTGPNAMAWNATNDSAVRVPDGKYTFKVTAVNPVGKVAQEMSGTINIDANAPVVTSMAATPNPFEPGIGNLNIKYDLNEAAKVTVNVYNGANVLVKTLATALPNLAGTNTLTWDGKDNAGASVPDGAYSYKLFAVDGVGWGRNAYGTFKVMRVAPAITDVRAAPELLKVTGTTASTIYYNLNKQANVTIKVYNSSNQLIRTILDNAPTDPGVRPAAWNGQDDLGALVEDGVYTYKINAVDAQGRAAREMSGTITTDKTAPLITAATATPSPFNPARDQSLSFKYDLNEASKITINIYNTSNVLVKTVASALPNTAGTNSVAWDGKNTAGTLVPAGAYSYRILATDNAGLSRSFSGVFKVE